MAMPLVNVLRRNFKTFCTFEFRRQSSQFVKAAGNSRLYSSTSSQPTQTVNETDLDDSVQNVKVLRHDDYFNIKHLVTIKELFSANVHLGHKSGCRNPFMAPYIYGNRLGLDIIDLEQTKTLLQDALNFTAHIAYRGGIILFISRNRQTLPLVEETARECGEYAHCRYWKGGTFTNVTSQFTRLPELCIFINCLNSVFDTHIAVIDSAKLMIPSVGVVDTNCDPRLISYPVPGNDDTPVAVDYYCRLFKAAIMAGKQKRFEDGHA
ncbi:28S ribosomal protein S2, mitochondrial [Patella vulgata]|uniref:28S ribosomal protein S2, mitochondrial n=1 Tax=Patella vulgata TaxID=6465 RepID=UPI0021803C41|nr:28S ribosomal protein S2, mitochondrial [Patella vulgata]